MPMTQKADAIVCSDLSGQLKIRAGSGPPVPPLSGSKGEAP